MKRSTRKKVRGGKKIGEGSFGTVYAPPLKCKGEAKTFGEGYVSKILSAEDLKEEYEASLLVRAMDPEGAWSITAEEACDLNAEQTNANYVQNSFTQQIIFKHGGINLFDLLLKEGVSGRAEIYAKGYNDAGDEDPSSFKKLNPERLSTFIFAVKNALPAIERLNEKYIHGDLHLGNIIFDGHSSKLIDFASIRPVETLIAKETAYVEKCINADCGLYQYRAVIGKDFALIDDIRSVWQDVYKIVNSDWVFSTFPGRFNGWVEKYKHLTNGGFRSDYLLSLYHLPA